ncbi:aldose 1- [Plasmopara halstedii]|uniref:glucose-6-phosphate 1-epimerase n=1 Tax=Plasmopara halstedii TaxID=4781 RepID=A0A0P1AQ64_PLAHL|nr:aldose 1- [Plasmopara halstedii]CEG43610.1 aldose 1- [Plasmopara halstedii]|eukprot:XP_024579979.1 aldose 1- [Plasmopara halstedii]
MVNPPFLKTAALVSTVFATINAELEFVKLTHPMGSCVEIFKFGAHVKSFHPAMDPTLDILFMSKESFLNGKDPVRGGIPIIFPNFGSAKGLPSHGFARITNWTLSNHENSKDKKKPSVANFTMASSEETLKIWPSDFELTYEVKLYPNQLTTALHVHNKHKETIKFHALLHNYLWVDDARNKGVQVHGLKNVDYYDKVAKANKTETRDYIDFKSQTDNVYSNAPDKISVLIKGIKFEDRTVTIDKAGSISVAGKSSSKTKTDVVVWNPWADRAKTMEDFGDEEYKNMVAVEPGRVSVQQELPAGQTYTLKETISVIKL